jgi:hypothetical protein
VGGVLSGGVAKVIVTRPFPERTPLSKTTPTGP